jgi:hypothetical protein
MGTTRRFGTGREEKAKREKGESEMKNIKGKVELCKRYFFF